MSNKVTCLLVVFQTLWCILKFAKAGPTVLPELSFNAYEDAKTIWSAVDGWGTSEDKISRVLCRRTYEQRMKIATSFEIEHGNLKKKLEDETSRDLKKLYSRLLESPAAILSNDMFETIEGKRKDYGAVTEILCATSNEEKFNVAVHYTTFFNMTVMDHVKNYKKDNYDYQIALSEYCWRSYCEIPRLDYPQAIGEAIRLFYTNPKTDCEKFKKQLQALFHTFCIPDIRLILKCYRSFYEGGIEEAIKESMQGEEAEAYTALTLSIEDRYKYFAGLLKAAMDGVGTDEDRINRIILNTCETYLGDILEEYKCMFEKGFIKRLKGFKGEFGTQPHYVTALKLLCNDKDD
ncbi:annexin A13-like [Planococcus citri]|uniref:annexin A13-like n=1 Tax=Planococcus citri TaxID=170843 RepID=UPI0031F825B1